MIIRGVRFSLLVEALERADEGAVVRVVEVEGPVHRQPVMLIGGMHPTLAGTTVAAGGLGAFAKRKRRTRRRK